MSIWMGVMAAIGILVVLFKINFRRIIHYDLVADIGITVALVVMFAGTYSGMVAAMAGGLFASIVLLVLKKTFKHDSF